MQTIFTNIKKCLFVFTILTASAFAQISNDKVLESVQNYPNPFNLQTQIQFSLNEQTNVSVKIFNILGKEIRTLLNDQQKSAGKHQIEWDGKDNNGNVVPSGMYLYQIQAGEIVVTRKMSLLK